MLEQGGEALHIAEIGAGHHCIYLHAPKLAAERRRHRRPIEETTVALQRTGFGGFPAEAFRFYEQLSAENTRAFWIEHRHDYDVFVREPFEALAAPLAAEFGPLHIFRPNRDVRFSKDKSPYKTHCGAVTEGEGGEAYYLQISSSGLMVASGYYGFARDQLQRYRDAVDSKAGKALDRLLESYRPAMRIGGAFEIRPAAIPKIIRSCICCATKACMSRDRLPSPNGSTPEGPRSDRDHVASGGAVAQVAQSQRRSEHRTARPVVSRARGVHRLALCCR